MSERYPGGVITKNAIVPTPSSAPGVWTLDQQLQAKQAGIWPYGGPFIYIEDVFSTWLYNGTGASQTITNGIDLSTKGGLVWMKGRSGATDHALYDTARGTTKDLVSNTTAAETTQSTGLTAFGTTGFTIGALAKINTNAATYASWTFRKQAKFFDVVTYTGDGNNNRTVSHNLGSVPGCIIVKRTDGVTSWGVWHRATNSGTGNAYLFLNSTNAQNTTGGALWGDNSTNTYVAPTSTNFTVSSDNTVNTNGATYVAYLFAHNAGGFGAAGTDNVISCGSFTTDANGDATVTLGYEPQWLLLKPSSAVGAWYMYDIMRGLPVTASSSKRLSANTSAAEVSGAESIYPTATGFTETGQLNGNTTYIYIAIRRGPMKTPTDATKVFSPALISGNGSSQTISSPGFAPDLVFGGNRSSNPLKSWVDKLRGRGRVLQSYDTSAEASSATNEDLTAFLNTGFSLAADWNTSFNTSGSSNNILWTLQRAPGFFDVVCYTGTGVNRTVTHGLGVVPELIIVKSRGVQDWPVYSAALGANNRVRLNQNIQSAQDLTLWNNTAPTSSVFSLGTATESNQSAVNYVAYLFASCPGVSKVGSYTGTGTTKQIDCGFTGGARFVLIKRTESTGDWYVWDSARGIVAGNDPYLLLNDTAAEVTNTDYVDTYSAGFEISSTAPAAINANGGTFIFLAIA